MLRDTVINMLVYFPFDKFARKTSHFNIFLTLTYSPHMFVTSETQMTSKFVKSNIKS